MSDADLAELRKQCITGLYVCTDNITKYLDNEKEAEFEKFQTIVQKYCVLEARQNVAAQALERTKNETDLTNIDTVKDRFTRHLEEYSSSHANAAQPFRMELNKRYHSGLQRISQNMDDSDLAITESQQQYLDPITKRPIQDPVRNTLCGHIYDKESILSMININKRIRCPVVGCANTTHIAENHLIVDEEMRFRMAITQNSTMLPGMFVDLA